MNSLQSRCCGGEVSVEGRTTHYYVCEKCGKCCDAVEPEDNYFELAKQVTRELDRSLKGGSKQIACGRIFDVEDNHIENDRANFASERDLY